MRVFVAGEGSDELGGWCAEPAYRDTSRHGLVETLVRKLAPEADIEIVGAVQWSKVSKYRAGGFRTAEERNVLGMALRAREANADVVVFVRDRDRDAQRERDIEQGIELASAAYGHALRIAGGVAIEEIESWLLSLLGDAGAESLRNPKEKLADKHNVSTLETKRGVVEARDLNVVPQNAASFVKWRHRVRASLESRS